MPVSHNGSKLASQKALTTVDLFAGCGGLSLGFELHKGGGAFETVLAIDNERPVIDCFNVNRPRPFLPTGRLADMTWFSHPSEVLLYYLNHIASWRPDRELRQSLDEDLGFTDFLVSFRELDAQFLSRCSVLFATPSFKEELSKVPAATFSLAIVKGLLGKLGLRSLRRPGFAEVSLPWRDEYLLVPADGGERPDQDWAVADELQRDARKVWRTEIDRLEASAQRNGRGQHTKVSERLRCLVELFTSSVGGELEAIWVNWRSQRDSIRARYCLAVESGLAGLYRGDRMVDIVLGGPPCKGFSRIGRAVIEDLRDQGVHAWGSHDYGDERNALMHRYVLFLDALRPKAFLFENVAHFQSSLRTPSGRLDASQVLAESIQDLSGGGLRYEVRSTIARAKLFGIPQDRERYIMVGFNADKTHARRAVESFFDMATASEFVPLEVALLGLPSPAEFDWTDTGSSVSTGTQCDVYTLIDPLMPETTRHYLEWIRQPNPISGATPASTDAHIVRRLREDDARVIAKFAPGKRWMDYKLESGGRTLRDLRQLLEAAERAAGEGLLPDGIASQRFLKDLLERVDEGLVLRLMMEDDDARFGSQQQNHLLGSGYLRKGTDSHGDWFERLSPSRPSKTIVAHIGKDTYGYFHPYQPRAISIREAARIQSFPDYFDFGSAGVVDGYAMIGNAVPPLLADVFASRFDSIRVKGLLVHNHDSEAKALPRHAQLNLTDLSVSTNYKEPA